MSTNEQQVGEGCRCDLRYDAPTWWANTPGLHHLAPCSLRPAEQQPRTTHDEHTRSSQ